MVTFNWEETDAKEKAEFFEKTNSLSWVVIELTDKCNFNCTWCYANASFNGQYMSKEKVEKIIKILSDEGIIQITFSGGEPLLYPHLREIIRTAKNHGMIVHINTNGYLLNKKLAKELYDAGLSQVQINIDSLDSRKHDKIRGKKGSFYRAVKALKNSKDVGLTCVSQTVLTKQNENEIVNIFKFVRSMGIQRCRLSDMIPAGRAAVKTYLKPTNFIGTLKKLEEFAFETGAKNIESGDPLFSFNNTTKLDLYGGFCPASTGMFTTISPMGDVYFCATHRKFLYNIFSDLRRGDNLNKFHSSKLENFIRLNNPSLKCKRCDYFRVCKGGCPSRRGYTLSGADYWCQS